MAIRYIPGKRFTDLGERVSDADLHALATAGIAIVEPETVGATELNSANIQTILGALSPDVTAIHDTITVASTAVASTVSTLMAEYKDAPAGSTLDSIVAVEQSFTKVYWSGYIEAAPALTGGTSLRVRLVAHNMSNASETVAGAIKYAVHTGTKTLGANSPNALLTVTPGFSWTDGSGNSLGLPVNADNLNATAFPNITIPDGSIGPVELNGTAIAKLAARYTGHRANFTVASTTSVPIGPAVLLGTVSFPSAAGSIVRVGQPSASPIYTGYVSASNGSKTISLYARNSFFATQSIPAGTVLKVFVY